MIQVIERRRVNRRIFERRRSPHNLNVYATGIYRCDFCQYDAESRSDDIKHHLDDLLHSLLRIFHQIIDCALEACSSVTRTHVTSFGATIFGTKSPGTTSSGATGPGATSPGANSPGANSPGANNPGANNPGATGSVKTIRPPAGFNWKECISENLYGAGQAIALVATFSGGVVFAATALLFAMFPGSSQTADFHEAMEREYRRKVEAERKRREEEEERLENEEQKRRDEDDHARTVQDELEKLEIHLKRNGFKDQDLRDETALRENAHKKMKLNYAASDVLDGKSDISDFDKDVNEFRRYEEERTKRNLEQKKQKEDKYRQCLGMRADARFYRKEGHDAWQKGDDRSADKLFKRADSLDRDADYLYKQSL
jgi:Skp family chaperone for outer membrane proteins